MLGLREAVRYQRHIRNNVNSYHDHDGFQRFAKGNYVFVPK